MKRVFIFIVTVIVFVTFLSACGATAASPESTVVPTLIPTKTLTGTPTMIPTTAPTDFPVKTTPVSNEPQLPPQSDSQGAVEITVTPEGLSNGADTLDFYIVMNTHSVELNFDLAALSTLKTDTGLTLKPIKWDGPSNGHHVEGGLSFPGQLDGKPVLAGVSQLTLIIQGVDAPERTFAWELVQ